MLPLLLSNTEEHRHHHFITFIVDIRWIFYLQGSVSTAVCLQMTFACKISCILIFVHKQKQQEEKEEAKVYKSLQILTHQRHSSMDDILIESISFLIF